MRILAGTSGFSYAAWKGVFYPEKLPASRMLAAYAGRLPTVEINATFYRLPRAETLDAWRAQVPADFVFALKGSRRVTHLKRLASVSEEVGYFYRTVAELGGTLGPVLWQLPPTLKLDLGLLRAFLELLPRGGRAALEFRHPSWFTEPALTSLSDAGVALCLADEEDEERARPLVATARFAYLRLRRPDYDDAALAGWVERVRGLPLDAAYVFFKHELLGPAWALRFGELSGAGAQALEAMHP
jgi:uncharacterized protein YecE (DUF72 family)